MKIMKTRGTYIAIALLLVTGTSIAGDQSTTDIFVYRDSGYATAQGNLGAGHYNGRSRYIGCQIVGTSGTTVPTVTCAADWGQENQAMSCSAPVSGVDLIASESLLDFTDSNVDNSCETVATEVSSSFLTKSAVGNTASTGVTITTSNGNTIATGALGTIYRTADNAQQMGCKLSAAVNFSTGAATNTVSCSAYDNSAPQKLLRCSSTSASVVQAALAIREDSYLEITGRDGSTCTKLLVKNDSRYDSHHGARR